MLPENKGQVTCTDYLTSISQTIRPRLETISIPVAAPIAPQRDNKITMTPLKPTKPGAARRNAQEMPHLMGVSGRSKPLCTNLKNEEGIRSAHEKVIPLWTAKCQI